MISSRWKGKERAVPRDEGSGGTEGIVLPLQLVGSGLFDAAYTLPVKVGQNAQTFSLQVDTGSSDMWIASTSCSTSSCGQNGGHLYNPNDARQTGASFKISYLSGNVSGDIVWDRVEIGGYGIDSQALAAADFVVDEPLQTNFDGILGLALPLNSVIASEIAPVTNNNPDGAVWASNLFSITPTPLAPASRFLSLSLSRPGSDRVPSLLGIGRHPSQLVQDPSLIQYAPLVSTHDGSLFWKASVRAITVYVNGEAREVALGRSNSGAVFPSAVLDSGVPRILTTSAIANAIYGAINVGPGADGSYYVPCNTPLNMTITLDTRSEIPLHPLDLTTEPSDNNRAESCVGLIQAADAQLALPNSGIGDMILGVPFLRNTYTVMAYAVPDSNGSFTADDMPDVGQGIHPRLGLLGLTDPAVALDEFNTVRILDRPLDKSGSSGDNTKSTNTKEKKLSVGIIVLIGLLGFFALCFSLFGLRWFLFRRKYMKGAGRTANADESSRRDFGEYSLALRTSQDGSSVEYGQPKPQFGDYVRKDRMLSDATMSSNRTQVANVADVEKEEFGIRADGNAINNTLVGLDGNEKHDNEPSSPERPYHRRTSTQMEVINPASHQRQLSIGVPLLPGDNEATLTHNMHSTSGNISDEDLAEFGAINSTSMAGIGTAARTSKIDSFRNSVLSASSNTSAPGAHHPV